MDISQQLQSTVAGNLGISHLPPDLQQLTIAGVGENVMRRVMVEVVKVLSLEDQAQFRAFSEKGDREGLMNFLKTKVPNFDAIMVEQTKRTIE